MSIIEAIRKRESIRTYTDERLTREQANEIERFIRETKAPFDVEACIKLIHAEAGEKPVKLGTYGFISGATNYIILIYKETPFAEVGSAYLFEQVILFCTSMGLGTCWLGGSFSRGDFKKHAGLQTGEKLRIVSPVGYSSGKRRFLDTLVKPKKQIKNPRRPFNTLFYNKDFSTPLEEDMAGDYFLPLEMVRLGPSASNKQSCRVVVDYEKLHFYKAFSNNGFSDIDLGIALCHFEQSCIELGIKGRFEVLDNAPANKSAQYTISWLSE